MRRPTHAVILAGIVLTALAGAWAQATDGQTAAPAAALRIVAPKPGERLQQTFVTVQYQLTNPGITAGSPQYRVQLDNRDPVVTTATETTFTSVTPGSHSLTVDLVDANNTPINGSATNLNFTTVAPPAPRAALPHELQTDAPLRDAARPRLPQGDQASDQGPAGGEERALPGGSSALPLLSLIGFGALVGGIASALKTR